MNEQNRPIHPIGVVAQRTGLTAEVVRAWERRYGVVEPGRDDAGRRLYSDNDLERLKLLAQATAAGRSIGQVAGLPTLELAELVRADASARWSGIRPVQEGSEVEASLRDAWERVTEMDAEGLEATLRRAATVHGARPFLSEIVAPLFRRIGDAWHDGELSIAAEHLASAVALPLLTGLRGAVPPRPDAPCLVVATPAGERHGIGALLCAATAALEGWCVTFLGPDLPAAEIAAAAVRKRARAVALSVVSAGANATDEIATLRRHLPSDVALVIGGSGSQGLAPIPEGAAILPDLDALTGFLRGA